MKTFITWDLGATKCAAALVQCENDGVDFNCKRTFTTKIQKHDSLDDLVEAIECGLDFSTADADAVCIGAAGQFNGVELNLESRYPYPMTFAEMAKKRHWPNYAVIHDYAPIVCATFTSYMHHEANVKRLNNSEIQHSGRRVALGIGTGLGLKDGVLFENGDFWLGRNEMGHIGISTPAIKNPVYQKRHADLLHFLSSEHLIKPHEPLTFERILTGQGMLNLFHYCYPSRHDIRTPEELADEIYQGKAKDVLALFAWYLGLFVGTVQLTFMPEGGIWITGGVVLNHLSVFDYSEFNEGIASTPGYLTLRQHIPLGVLCGNQHAFMGAGYYASKRLLQKCVIASAVA